MLPPQGERLWTLNTVRIPEGIDDPRLRKQLLDEFSIEIGAGLGPLAGKIWRVGLMGASSAPRLIVLLLGALREAMAAQKAELSPRRRMIARLFLGASAVAFACLVYVYLYAARRPSAALEQSADDRVHRAARGRGAGEGEDAAPGPAVGQHREHFARLEARRHRDRRRCVLAARGDRFRADASLLEGGLGARPMVHRGGSTITQQLAKNLYLSPSRNPLRKVRELIIARRLEAELSKTRILELYLNVIEWGDGIYGVEAAARTYFHTSAAVLGPSESAALAACIVNPRRMNPAHPTPGFTRRQQLILRRMGGGELWTTRPASFDR